MADFWSFTIVVGLLCDTSSCHHVISGEKTLDTHPATNLLPLRDGCTQLSSSLAANLRRSRRHTLLLPIDRDSPHNRPTHLLSALLHPQEFRGDMAQYPSTIFIRISFDKSIIIIKWTIFSRSTSNRAIISFGYDFYSLSVICRKYLK